MGVKSLSVHKKITNDVTRMLDAQSSDGATQRTLTVGGSITVRLVSSLTSVKLSNEGNIILFVFSEAV